MARVGMVAYTYYRSDPRVRREAEALAQRGDEVEFFCLRKPGEPAVETVEGVTVRHLGMERYRGGSTALYVASYVAFFFRALFAVSAAHLRNPYDVVHTNNMPDFMAFTALVPRFHGCGLIHDIHDTMPEIYQGKFGAQRGHPLIRLLRLQERMAGAFAHRVLTSEHTKKEALIEHGLKADSIEVLLNMPDPRVFVEASPPAPAEDEFRLVFHGTMAERLGLDIALNAVRALRDEIPELRMDLIGDGDQRPDLIRMTRELGLEDRVRFSDGFVPIEELPRILAGADLGIIPTRDEITTRYMLPTKLVEYVALGIPAIVAPTHTVRYYFDESQVEFFEAGDETSLARKIRKLHADPERRAEMVRNSRRFLDEYAWEHHKRIYLDLVDSLTRR